MKQSFITSSDKKLRISKLAERVSGHVVVECFRSLADASPLRVHHPFHNPTQNTLASETRVHRLNPRSFALIALMTSDQGNFLVVRLRTRTILRHSINNQPSRPLRIGKNHACTLFCEREDDEGLNLQLRQTIAFRFERPNPPDRIAQRTGRLDLLGLGTQLQIATSIYDSPTVQKRWFEPLETVHAVIRDHYALRVRYRDSKQVLCFYCNSDSFLQPCEKAA